MAGRAGLWIVPDGRGRQWISTADACELLGVRPMHLARWVRRSAAEPGFPRVDPPKRAHGKWWYILEQLVAAETRTAAATRGRRRPDA